MSGIELIENYLTWVRSSFDINRTTSSIKTPYKRPDGDFISLQLKTIDGKRYLTDDGETFNYLFISGIDLNSKSTNRENIIGRIINSNGVTFLEGIELGVELTDDDDIGFAISRLLRAINAVQYLIYTTRPGGIRYFKENVADYFTQNKIPFELDYVVPGKAREHRFDFYISKKEPYLIKTLSTENHSWARRLATDTMFDFVDTKQLAPQYMGIALLDDRRPEIWTGDALAILDTYSDYVIKWKDRDQIMELVA